MTATNFSTAILVDQSPSEVFKAVNNPRAWWSEEIKGGTNKLDDEFDYHFEDIHRCRIKIVELVPGKKVVWHVLENYFKPGIFDDAPSRKKIVHDKAEWVDTKIVFEITEAKNKTQLKFTHAGLVPEYECFDVCVNGWTHYVQQSLFGLITKGTGQPNKTGKPKTKDEEKFHAAKG
jgi:hypothetical protein